jgi:hypothetical protein
VRDNYMCHALILDEDGDEKVGTYNWEFTIYTGIWTTVFALRWVEIISGSNFLLK